MIDIDVDTSGLERAIAEFAETTGKDLRVVAKQQMGILVGHVIAITPPGESQVVSDQGGIALAAKLQGEARMAADIASLFVTTRLPPAVIERIIYDEVFRDFEWKNPVKGGRSVRVFRRVNTLAEMARIHKAGRSGRSGRAFQAGGGNMAIARPALVKQYIRQEIKKVGLLNAGWIAAARELGTAARAVPAWITRHGLQPGGSTTTGQGKSINITIFNNQSWFPGNMEMRVRDSVRRREAGLQKAMQAILDRRAKAAEQSMGR